SARTDGGTQGFFARAGAVVAQIALHHQVERFDLFGHAKRTGQNAVGAGDATRRVGAVHDTKLVFRDGVGGTDLRADGVFAVHADLERGLRRQKTIHIVHMNHGGLTVGFAFRASHFACVAADAPLRVKEELLVGSERGAVHALA